MNKAYRDDALKVAVYGASSIGIVVMLYEGAIKAIRLAEQPSQNCGAVNGFLPFCSTRENSRVILCGSVPTSTLVP